MAALNKGGRNTGEKSSQNTIPTTETLEFRDEAILFAAGLRMPEAPSLDAAWVLAHSNGATSPAWDDSVKRKNVILVTAYFHSTKYGVYTSYILAVVDTLQMIAVLAERMKNAQGYTVRVSTNYHTPLVTRDEKKWIAEIPEKRILLKSSPVAWWFHPDPRKLLVQTMRETKGEPT